MATTLNITDNNMVAVWMVAPEITLTKRQLDNRARKYLEAKERLKVAEAEYKRLKAEVDEIKDALIDDIHAREHSNTAEGNKYIISNTVYVRKDVDATRLKKERPDIAEEFCKESIRNTFTVKLA